MTQIERIIYKFGSVENLRQALELSGLPKYSSSIYRWNLRKSKMKGLIPATCLPYIIQAARMEGILLTSEDLDPRPGKGL